MSRHDRFALHDVASLAEQAIRRSVQFLSSMTRPSIWHARGKGWQELLDRSPTAGFYASCDGVQLLTTSPLQRTQESQRLAWTVYAKTLCPVLETELPPQNEFQRRMRDTVLKNTMKLSRFIVASLKWRKNSQTATLVNRALRRVVARGHNGKWTIGPGRRENTYLAATCEATQAISAWKSRATSNTQMALADLFDLSLQTRDPKVATVAIWAVSALPSFWNAPSAVHTAHRLVELIGAVPNSIYREDFFIPGNIQDYYSYDVDLVAATALLRFCENGLLPPSSACKVLPLLDRICRSVNRSGRYCPDTTFHFWQHHQAMILVALFWRLWSEQRIQDEP
jgi:hypothetical protein